MMPCSFHGTRVIGVPPPSSIAWNMPTAAWYSMAPCCVSTHT